MFPEASGPTLPNRTQHGRGASSSASRRPCSFALPFAVEHCLWCHGRSPRSVSLWPSERYARQPASRNSSRRPLFRTIGCCAASGCSSWVRLKGKASVYSYLVSRWYHSSRPAVRCKPSVRFASDVELQHQQTNMTRQQDASHPTQPRGPPSTTSHYQRRQLL